jgi:hypothetical protein
MVKIFMAILNNVDYRLYNLQYLLEEYSWAALKISITSKM